MPVRAKTKSTKSTPIHPIAATMWIVRVSFRADADSRQGRRVGGRVVVTVLVAFMTSRLAYAEDQNIRQVDDLGVLRLGDTPGGGAQLGKRRERLGSARGGRSACDAGTL